MRIYEILPGKLYQSGEFRKLPIDEKLHSLGKYGIDTVVNLYKNEDNELKEYLYEYIYNPLSDGKNFDSEQVMEIVETITDIIMGGHKVLVHCHVGRNRSGLINALVVMQVARCTGDEAIRIVRKARPRAIDNDEFERFIREL